MLSCCTIASSPGALLGPLDDRDGAPANGLRARSGLHDAHRAAGPRVVIVARLHLRAARDLLAVLGVGQATDQQDGDRLVHLVADDNTLTGLACGALGA